MRLWPFRHTKFILFLFLVGLIGVTVVLAEETFTFTGALSFSGDTDTYSVHIPEGQRVVADLICDELSPGNRPLDPYLSVNDPNGAEVANDDDSGSSCNAFNSSHLSFRAQQSGDYEFVVSQAASNSGPYILRIRFVDAVAEEPELSLFDPGDARINRQAYARAAVYCDDSRVVVYGIDADGNGQQMLSVPFTSLPPSPTDTNVLIAQNGDVAMYRLTAGEYQVNAGPDSEGKIYVAVWDGCPYSYLNAYILQNGVLTQTESNTP